MKTKTKPNATPRGVVTHAAHEQVVLLALEALRESPTNPRQTFSDAGLAELAESIKAQGVLQPILARPVFDDDPEHTHEIVFGHRRFRAARLAGMRQVPAIVRFMSGEEVALAQLHENLEREDVHPIEEGEAYARLMANHGTTAAELMEQTGKSRTYVYNRLKLTALTPEVREACLAGVIDSEVATLIARVPAPMQAQALKRCTFKDCTETGTPVRSVSCREARQRLEASLTAKLSEAVFDQDDAELCPKAGSCISCPKMSNNDPALHELGGLVCTDVECFEGKEVAATERRLAAARAEGRLLEGDAAAAARASSDYVPLYMTCYTGMTREGYVTLTYAEAIAKLAECHVATPAVILIDRGGSRPAEYITIDSAKRVKDALRELVGFMDRETPSTAAQREPGAAGVASEGDEAAGPEDATAAWTDAERALLDGRVARTVHIAVMHRAFGAKRETDELRLVLLAHLEQGDGFGLTGKLVGLDDAYALACAIALDADQEAPDEDDYLRIWVASHATADQLAGVLVMLAIDASMIPPWRSRHADDTSHLAATDTCRLAQRYGVDVLAEAAKINQTDGAGDAGVPTAINGDLFEAMGRAA